MCACVRMWMWFAYVQFPALGLPGLHRCHGMGDSASYITHGQHTPTSGEAERKRGWGQTRALTSADLFAWNRTGRHLGESRNKLCRWRENKIKARKSKIRIYSDAHVWPVVKPRTHVYARWHVYCYRCSYCGRSLCSLHPEYSFSFWQYMKSDFSCLYLWVVAFNHTQHKCIPVPSAQATTVYP